MQYGPFSVAKNLTSLLTSSFLNCGARKCTEYGMNKLFRFVSFRFARFMEGISEWRLGIVACFGIASFTSIFFFRLSVRTSFPECLFFFLSFFSTHCALGCFLLTIPLTPLPIPQSTLFSSDYHFFTSIYKI